MMRVQKALAQLGIGSRRQCEKMIAEGRVRLAGELVGLGQTVSTDEIEQLEVDGRRVGKMPDKRYLLLNKKAGFVTTVSDPQGRPTVMDLLPEEAMVGHGRLYPVGRLDRDTVGALLFTNDGELANRLLHPSTGVEKEYRARVEGQITDEAIETLRRGPLLDDGPTVPPVEVRRERDEIVMVITEGRKRQVKRMLEHVGLRCLKLERLRFGALDCRGLSAGSFRELESSEVEALRKLCQD